MKAHLRWLGPELQFEGTTESAKTIKLDSTRNTATAIGPSPMELVLQALGGCTAMDVVSILQKMRRTIISFDVEIEAERREEYPKIYTHIHIFYKLRSPDTTENDLERAIRLSDEKYCSVAAMLRPTAKITSSFELRRAPV
ncbi:MAG: OsmC family protein [candidate division KSB1 bacterium]|nr:OsmC family protein [candidate division KSB1 bacterium]MDZ7302114.1 OsmC family protein [candidate division KSB1 bacterium]MDZ7311155.1 OsmC family protein [candidate division KSB1 bacterium]